MVADNPVDEAFIRAIQEWMPDNFGENFLKYIQETYSEYGTDDHYDQVCEFVNEYMYGDDLFEKLIDMLVEVFDEQLDIKVTIGFKNSDKGN